MLTFQPRDRSSGGRGLLVLSVQPDGVAYELDIVGKTGRDSTIVASIGKGRMGDRYMVWGRLGRGYSHCYVCRGKETGKWIHMVERLKTMR